ncbi:hypothetical protein ABZ734_33695 [Streptomyces sp. NPDC006660]|uniref:hypothetical protein n=1 Tax=Streptomyces sp. NPDC006660 TaxID=3156901 RepID=UPI0033E5FD7B
MADSHFSAAPAAAHPDHHPMANPGYGKRSVPHQQPPTAYDFAHLAPREAAVAGYLDRLPDGADISVKTLAKVLPYGQCALRTALQRLVGAGHLRRGREHLRGSDSARWVTRTWFSRTARDDAWWAEFTRGCVNEAPPSPPRPPGPPAAAPQPPTRSRAFILLAALGRTAPALSLSARDCADLEPLAEAWFERGATEQDILRALAAGLPVPVHSPAGLTRTRLLSKLPPHQPPPPTRPALRILECAKCGAPGPPDALPGGTCAPCQGKPRPHPPALPAAQVHSHAAKARAAATTPRPSPRPTKTPA